MSDDDEPECSYRNPVPLILALAVISWGILIGLVYLLSLAIAAE